MPLGATRTLRAGVLVSVLTAAFLLWLSTMAAWWTVRTDVGGFRYVEVSLASFGGTPFLWSAGAACLAFAVAALPVPAGARRAAVGAGFAATVAAALMWAVVLVRMLRRDADTHRGWASEVWARRLAAPGTDPGPALAETRADGSDPAFIVVFLLLVIGCVLIVPRRRERDVLLTAGVVSAVTALTTTAVPVWVTTGPEAA